MTISCPYVHLQNLAVPTVEILEEQKVGSEDHGICFFTVRSGGKKVHVSIHKWPELYTPEMAKQLQPLLGERKVSSSEVSTKHGTALEVIFASKKQNRLIRFRTGLSPLVSVGAEPASGKMSLSSLRSLIEKFWVLLG